MVTLRNGKQTTTAKAASVPIRKNSPALKHVVVQQQKKKEGRYNSSTGQGSSRPASSSSASSTVLVVNQRGIIARVSDPTMLNTIQTSVNLMAVPIGAEIRRYAALHGFAVNAKAMPSAIARAFFESCMCEGEQ